VEIRVAHAGDRPAIARFNERLHAGGQDERLPLDGQVEGEGYRTPDGTGQYRRLIVAHDGAEVRAGMVLFDTRAVVAGDVRNFAWVYNPVSEGLIDRTWTLAIVHLVKWAQGNRPFLMCLGVGSMDEKWAQFMVKMNWRHAPVPFLFLPLRPKRVLRDLPALRSRPAVSRSASLAAAVGGGAVLAGILRTQRVWATRRAEVDVTQEEMFGPWADVLYDAARADYGAAVVRDQRYLEQLYQQGDDRYRILRVRDRSGAEAGWTVVTSRRMQENRYFGNLHVGTLVDGFGTLGSLPAVLGAAVQRLADEGVDLVIANLSHDSWVKAARRLGFLPGPTNFYFFVSPGGAPLLEPTLPVGEIHLARGDCEGPLTLAPPTPLPTGGIRLS